MAAAVSTAAATDFTDLLGTAEGRSEYIICVFADVRDFSAFCHGHDAPEVAMYIRRVYIRLLRDFFPEATFFKPTGDGLLLVYRCEQNNQSLLTTAADVIDACVACVEAFPSICEGDLMVNFAVPQRIGIGIARGTACCLHSGGRTLDYSGHVLNLAARLMGMARPGGIVIDADFMLDALPAPHRHRFEAATVPVTGLSANHGVLVQRGQVVVPAIAPALAPAPVIRPARAAAAAAPRPAPPAGFAEMVTAADKGIACAAAPSLQ
jgi:class 3 adenylate cyclase